jgi:hypothetical protein
VFAASTPAPLATDATASSAQHDRPDIANAEIHDFATADPTTIQEPEQLDRKKADAPAPVAVTTEEDAAIDKAIRALANDDIPHNAKTAVDALYQFRDKAVPALQRALDSADEQQRHLAAAVLRWIDADPTRRLCELSIEALGDPAIEGYWRTLIHRPALSAVHWFDDHAQSKEVRSHLLVAARSPHNQRRFLAAALLARAGEQRDLPNTCAVLIAQLPDNEVLGDALVAAHGLYRIGPAALPQIRLAYRGADDQTRKLLQLVEENLADDAAGRKLTKEELRHRYDRLGIKQVTDVSIDPVHTESFLGFAVLPRL